MHSPRPPLLKLWTIPGELKTTITVLTHVALYSAAVKNERLDSVRAALLAQQEPREVLGSDSVAATLAGLVHVKFVLGETSLRVNESRTVPFPTEADLDDAFVAIRKLLGKGHEVQCYEETHWGKVIRGASILFPVLVLFVFLHWRAAEFEKSGEIELGISTSWKGALLDFVPQAIAAALGTTGVLLLGSVVMGLILAVLLYDLSKFQPVTTVTLSIAGYVPEGAHAYLRECDAE